MLNANEATASATNSIAASPTPCNNASFDDWGGLGVVGKSAKASKASPTTWVMKGAIPPEMKEAVMAGSTNSAKSLDDSSEKRSLMDG